jgi:hypothetical protein
MSNRAFRLPLILFFALLSAACGTRQVQDSLVGATAQQLLTHSIDDLAQRLPAADFAPHAGKRVHISSHFVDRVAVRDYADWRLGVELARRFDMQLVDDPDEADIRLEVFYTALGTDQSSKGFVLPVGFVPGLEESTRIDLITLEQFHGVAEMYYFLGQTGVEHRGDVLQARTRSDALGLPIITIPLDSIDRQGEGGD